LQVSFIPQLAAGKLAALNEQTGISLSIRYREGETADSSAPLGMTKGTAALAFWTDGSNDNLPGVVHSSVNLSQAS
jgi:hypothetical protein